MTLLLALAAAWAYPVSLTPILEDGGATDFDSCGPTQLPCADHPLVGPWTATAWFSTSGGTSGSRIGVSGGAAHTAAPGLAFSMGRLYLSNDTSGWADDGGVDVVDITLQVELGLADGSTGTLNFTTGIEYVAQFSGSADRYRMTGGSFQTRSLTHAGYRYDLTFSLFGDFINETFAGPAQYYYLYWWMDLNYGQADWAWVFDGSAESWRGVWSGRQVAVLSADAGDDQTVDSGERVTLQGGGGGDPVTFSWRQLSGPPVDLADADTRSPSFTAPQLVRDGELVFELTTTGSDLVRTDTVRVEVLSCDLDGDGLCDTQADCALRSLAPWHGAAWAAAEPYAVWSATEVRGSGRVDGTLVAGGFVSLVDARVGRSGDQLLAGADVQLHDTIVGGDLFTRGWLGRSGSTRVAGESAWFVDALPVELQTTDQLLELAWELSEVPVTGEILRRTGRVLEVRGLGDVVHVVLDAAELSTARELRVRARPEATVLLQIQGSTSTLAAPIVLDGPAADRVLLVAPDTSSLRLATDVPFGVLAPRAAVRQVSGAVTGGLFAWSVSGDLDVQAAPRFAGACQAP